MTPSRTFYDREKTDKVISILSEAIADLTFIPDEIVANKIHITIPSFVRVNVTALKSFELLRTDHTPGNDYVDPETTEVYGEVTLRRITLSSTLVGSKEKETLLECIQKIDYPLFADNLVRLTADSDPWTVTSVKDRLKEHKEYTDTECMESLVAKLNAAKTGITFIVSDTPQQYSVSLIEPKKPGFFGRLTGKKKAESELHFSLKP